MIYNILRRLKYFRRTIISRYLIPGGYSLAPTQIALFPTVRCNLRCEMCAQWGSAGSFINKNASDLAAAEMPLIKWKEIVDEVSSAKPLIIIWGGEPLLYRDILPLVAYIKSKQLHCLMITNGMLLEQYAAELARSGIDKIEVSIDGTPETNDSIRGSGAFDRATKGVKAVIKARQAAGRHSPRIIINTVITERTYKSLQEMVGAAKDLGADSVNFIYGWVIPGAMGEAYEKAMRRLFNIDAPSWKGFKKEESGIDLPELARTISRIKDASVKAGIETTFLPDLDPSDIAPFYRGVSGAGGCLSLWHRIDVRYNGDMVFCGDYPDYIIGNVKESGFFSIWNGRKARVFRKAVKKARMLPICSRCCNLYQYRFP